MDAGRKLACREGFVPARDAELYYRDIGEGRPIVVVHGGPDFDHRYLLPDFDRLAQSYRLIYYDQRGRGYSRGALRLEDVCVEQCVEDLDAVRAHFGLESVAILGHSWGGLLALHYAVARPQRVSHLGLLNTAPASYDDFRLTSRERIERSTAHGGALEALAARERFKDGDPDTVAAYYRMDYATAFDDPRLVERLRLTFLSRDDVVTGRAIEDRLMERLYACKEFTLLPELSRVTSRTLVIHGDRDFVPVPCARRIADAIPDSHVLVIAHCGHFAYIEAPDAVKRAIDAFLANG